MSATTSVGIKSTAQLVDETTTAAFRAAWAIERGTSPVVASERVAALERVLGSKLGVDAAHTIVNLAIILMATWTAQEIVMSDLGDAETARAARQAQRLNAHRTLLVRRIDYLLGEDGITVLEKTYR